jgi:hypothetical protein
MSHLQTRVARIEGKVFPAPPQPTRPGHIIGGPNAECETQRQALIDSGNAAESDLFVFLIPAAAAVGSVLMGCQGDLSHAIN